MSNLPHPQHATAQANISLSALPPPPPWWARHAWSAAVAKRIGGREARVKLKMLSMLGYWPNLKHPTTMNEKVVHRNLYTHDPRFAICADKIAVRDWVRDRAGPDVLIPLLGFYRHPGEIPWDTLMPPFVMKGSHGSTWVELVPHAPFDVDRLRAKATHWLSIRYRGHYESWYEQMPRGVIIERMLNDPNNPAAPTPDYKFWTYHGRVKIIQVDSDRFTAHKRVLYDRDWNPLPYSIKRAPGQRSEPPPALDRLIHTAECLAQGFDFVRVDLYCPCGHKVYFGELTFAPGAGLCLFKPIEMDAVVGGYW